MPYTQQAWLPAIWSTRSTSVRPALATPTVTCHVNAIMHQLRVMAVMALTIKDPRRARRGGIYDYENRECHHGGDEDEAERIYVQDGSVGNSGRLIPIPTSENAGAKTMTEFLPGSRSFEPAGAIKSAA